VADMALLLAADSDKILAALGVEPVEVLVVEYKSVFSSSARQALSRWHDSSIEG
jgi:hypothetical protein